MFIPGQNIDAALENFILNFYLPDSASFRADLLKETPDEDVTRSLETLADLLVSGAHDLAGNDVSLLTEGIESLIAMGSIDSLGARYQYLLSAMDARVAEDLVALASSASNRYVALATLMRRTTLSVPAARFLQRVSRCFLYGFDTECAVMCRGALDAELQAEISADDCAFLGRRARTRDGEPMYDLSDRIEAARKTKRFDDETAAIAHAVRKQTNMLLHRNPQPPKDVVEILARTLRVIEALQRAR